MTCPACRYSLTAKVAACPRCESALPDWWWAKQKPRRTVRDVRTWQLLGAAAVLSGLPFTAPTWGWWQVVANILGAVGMLVLVLWAMHLVFGWLARTAVGVALEVRHSWVGAVEEYEQQRRGE